MIEFQEDHVVVRNDEGQYSIWVASKKIPSGWYQIGNPMSRENCLKYIESNWLDMRPASLQGLDRVGEKFRD
ncbi:MbtH family protein [Hydrogenophaga soli]